LALTPSNNDAFFREVDEEVRRDRLAAFWTRRGGTVLLALGLFLVALAGGLWWKSHRTALAARDGEQLSAVLADVEAHRVKPADPRLVALGGSSRPGYRALADLTAAGLAVGTDPKDAIQRYRRVADDASLARSIRDLAQLRAMALQLDTAAPQAIVDGLKPLAQPGGPWFGPAAELTAAAYLKMNRRDLAGPLFAQIAREPGLPASLQARAGTMASALGQAVSPPSAATLKE